MGPMRTTALVTVAALLLAGCAGAPTHVVGTCLNSSASGAPPWVATEVSCDARHHYEVFATWRPEHPEADDLDAGLRQYCEAAFVDYVGIEPAASSLRIITWLPTFPELDHSDGSGLCLLYRPAAYDSEENPVPQQVIGSDKDSRR